jgi:hypothetical protein
VNRCCDFAVDPASPAALGARSPHAGDMTELPRSLDRRTLLRLAVAGGAAGLVGCSSASPATRTAKTSAPPGSPSSTPASPSPSTSVSARGVALSAPRPWVAGPGEVDPAVKRQALRALEAIGTWSSAGGGSLAAASGRLRALGMDPKLTEQAHPLLGAEPAAVTRVVDAQYGGILASSASVLAVLDQQRLDAAGHVHVGGTTVDVRLVAASPRWRITAMHPASPGPATTALGSAGRAVLANPRVRLPHAARADIASGQVHASVLEAVLALAHRYVVDVSIVRSGHPIYVFGTSRLSDHPRGRAVDVWALDGRRIVDPANRAFVESAMRVAASVGPYQVGGPVDLDGGGSTYFSDRTHQDHLHLGFHT